MRAKIAVPWDEGPIAPPQPWSLTPLCHRNPVDDSRGKKMNSWKAGVGRPVVVAAYAALTALASNALAAEDGEQRW